MSPASNGVVMTWVAGLGAHGAEVPRDSERRRYRAAEGQGVRPAVRARTRQERGAQTYARNPLQ